MSVDSQRIVLFYQNTGLTTAGYSAMEVPGREIKVAADHSTVSPEASCLNADAVVEPPCLKTCPFASFMIEATGNDIRHTKALCVQLASSHDTSNAINQFLFKRV